MTHTTVQTWLRKEPFVPFVIRMSNGEQYEVRHPENAALSQTNVFVVFPGTERYAELALLYVASVERFETSDAGTETH